MSLHNHLSMNIQTFSSARDVAFVFAGINTDLIKVLKSFLVPVKVASKILCKKDRIVSILDVVRSFLFTKKQPAGKKRKEGCIVGLQFISAMKEEYKL